MAITLTHPQWSPLQGQLGGFSLILSRYDLVSIQACVSLFRSMVEEAVAACGTKNTSSTWSLQTSPPCLDTVYPPKYCSWAQSSLDSHCLEISFFYFDLPPLQTRKDKTQFLLFSPILFLFQGDGTYHGSGRGLELSVRGLEGLGEGGRIRKFGCLNQEGAPHKALSLYTNSTNIICLKALFLAS